MILKIAALLAGLTFFSPLGFAEQTAGEKAKAQAHDAKRSAKKMGHRAQEMVCAENDAACLARKAKHRAQEGGEYMKDKAEEAKEKAD